MATDTQVQIAPDGTGAKIDNSQITRADTTVVNRQRVNLSDPSDPNSHASVSGEDGRGALGTRDRDVLGELQALNANVAELLELFREFLYS
jgi:hypothetical protein